MRSISSLNFEILSLALQLYIFLLRSLRTIVSGRNKSLLSLNEPKRKRRYNIQEMASLTSSQAWITSSSDKTPILKWKIKILHKHIDKNEQNGSSLDITRECTSKVSIWLDKVLLVCGHEHRGHYGVHLMLYPCGNRSSRPFHPLISFPTNKLYH